jgi:hypothetical protein
MSKFACITAVLVAAVVSLQADDATVKTVQENKLSSKNAGVNGTDSSTSTPKDLTPENLRDNPAYNIPFPQPATGFKDNPNPAPVKIGPMPDELRPMGAPKPMIKMTGYPQPATNKDEANIDLPARPVVEIPQATEKTPAANVSEETVTVSPFLDWIQNTKNAVEVAKQQRQAIEQSDAKDHGPKDGTDQDLFLHIRFPYVGSQDMPPSGGSVTYSVPQR